MKTIDCRELSCPEPVIRTKKALMISPDEDLIILVDNKTALENVMRFIQSRGKKAKWQEIDGTFHITVSGSKPGSDNASLIGTNSGEASNPVLLITSDQLGQGSSELGQMLMRNFIYTLTKLDELPRALVFMNAGVKLSLKESPVTEELEDLQARGVLILVCGTCLDYYELKDRHQAGQVSNMYDITDLLFSAERVITL